MGGIADEQVEWAVVNRLKAMLDAPPKTKFNVTQSFALFSAILLWTKQRAWVPDRANLEPADRAAREVRLALQAGSIFDAPWLLSKGGPQPTAINKADLQTAARDRINSDFDEMTVERFIKWVRDAISHGDGRSIKPIHKPSRSNEKSLLAGFEVRGTSRGDRERLLTLYHPDMRRIGAILADTFCKALSGGDKYFEFEAGTRVIEEAA